MSKALSAIIFGFLLAKVFYSLDFLLVSIILLVIAFSFLLTIIFCFLSVLTALSIIILIFLLNFFLYWTI